MKIQNRFLSLRSWPLLGLFVLACSPDPTPQQQPGPDMHAPVDMHAPADMAALVTWEAGVETDAMARCATAACHLAPAPAAAYKLTPGMSMANYMATRMFINLAAPAESKLITKAADRSRDHAGGLVTGFDAPNGAYYRKWLDWIQRGAPAR
jgi:hypothetical protein